MRRALLALTLFSTSLLTAPMASAEVTHHIDARFGVGYRSDASRSQSQLQPLYEGRYSATFTERADNGMTFRFELSVVVGNLPERGERRPPVNGALSVGVGSD